MKTLAALLTLAAMTACHRPRADQPTPGADGEAQARTAAKTIVDLQAADDASRGPAPAIAAAQPPHPPHATDEKKRPSDAAASADDATSVPLDGNGTT